MKTLIILLAVSFLALGQDFSALDNYKNQRALDSISKVTDSIVLDSLRRCENYKTEEIDKADKIVFVSNKAVDSLDKAIKQLSSMLCSDNFFKQMAQKDYDIATKKQYADFLVRNRLKTNSEIADWFISFLDVLNTEYIMLYIVMNEQTGNTRANANAFVRKRQSEMIEVVDIINHFKE